MKKTHIDFCQGGPCVLNGAEDVEKVLAQFPNIEVQYWGCLGNCTNGPNAIIDDVPCERLTKTKLYSLLLEKKVDKS